MPAKKKKKSYRTKLREVRSKQSGAYQTRKGGPVLNSRPSIMQDPAMAAIKAIDKLIVKSKKK